MAQSRAQAIEAINRADRDETIPPSQFKVDDRVWLDAKNLRLPYQTTKLAPKRHGPFRITKEVSPVAYQLSLPASWAIHDVFHASLLSPYQENTVHGPNFSKPPPDLVQGAEEYEVEHLVNHRRHGRSRTLQFFVKWKGSPESDNTWEPIQNIHAPDLLMKYYQRYPLEDKKRAKSKRKVSSRLRTTALCRTLQSSPLPVNPTNFPSPLWHITTRSPLRPSFPSMSLGKSSAKPRSATRRNRSQSHHARDSTSSETASAPPETRSRSLRGLRPPSRTGRASISSASSSSTPTSPDSSVRSSSRLRTGLNPTTTNAPVLWRPPPGSPFTPAALPTSTSPADEKQARWPNELHPPPLKWPHFSVRSTGPEM